MPVKARQLDGKVVQGRESLFQRQRDQDQHDSNPDDHVQRVHSRHHEVERKEDLRVFFVWLRKLEVIARDQVLFILVVVLQGFYSQKHRTEGNRRQQE